MTRPSPLDLVGSLIDQSLLRCEPVHGEPRYTMLETIREYALEQLDASGEAADVRQRHVEFCLRLAEEQWSRLAGAETAPWLDRLEREHDNLRAALGWLLDRGPVESGLRLCWSLWWFWSVRGHLGEGQRWLQRFLDRPEAASRSAARGRALFGSGHLSRLQGDYDAARRRLREALSIAREVGDRTTSAYALTELGDVADTGGDYEAARVYLREALAIRRDQGNRREVAATLLRLGRVGLRLGDHPGSRAALDECRTLAEEVGAQDIVAAAAYYVGSLAGDVGDRAAARAGYAESLALFWGLGYRRWIARVLEGMAGQTADLVPTRALLLAGAAARIREASGQPLSPTDAARLRCQLAPARHALGEVAAADAWASGHAASPERVLEEALAPIEPVTRRRPAVAGQGSALTRRERDVAALVARGYNNPTIGAELVITRRTVEAHISAILSKLGLSTRTQIAIWAVEQNL